MSTDESQRPVLVVGATGYVGGTPCAVAGLAGLPGTCHGGAPWTSSIAGPGHACPMWKTVQGDVRDTSSLAGAARGCDTAYYLVHSMIAEKRGYARARP